jgi:O-antigen/teichoic acid export membrane protein
VLGNLRNSLLARNTLWMLLGHGTRVVIQGVYFVIIARSLGPEGFGAFVGTVALVAVLVPFGTLGYENILVKNVARNPELFERYWGNALIMTSFFGSLLVSVAMVLSHYVLPSTISPLLIFSVAVADIIFTRILETSGSAFQALQRLGWTAQFHVLLNLLRLLAALGLGLLAASPTPVQWGLLYLLSAFLSAAIGFWIVHRKLGAAKPGLTSLSYELKEGFYFSISLSTHGIYNDIDKTMLARLSTLEATGIYAAAYRLINVSCTPIISLMSASYARFFQHGSGGIGRSFSYAKRLLTYAGAYGLFTGVALYLMAPLLPYLLGSDYQNAIEAVRWLALLPFLRALHYFVANALTGAGFQGLRSSVQVFVALFNVLINFLLIPIYTWRGAAWASVATDFLLLIGLLVVVWGIRRRERA